MTKYFTWIYSSRCAAVLMASKRIVAADPPVQIPSEPTYFEPQSCYDALSGWGTAVVDGYGESVMGYFEIPLGC